MTRPVKYETVEELETVIDAYFKTCEEKKLHLTITGLALAVDMTREGLLHYCRKGEGFADTIKRAKSTVEAYIEQKLFDPSATGCIFNLKNNFGWKDSQDINHGGQPDGIPVALTDMDKEEYKKARDAILEKF